MDERWESEIIEYGAINITGFRMIDTHKRYVKEFLEGWRKLDATTSPGAGKEQISVRTFSSSFSFSQHLLHLTNDP
jgi:glutamate receptor, ionotropic, invertebrate